MIRPAHLLASFVSLTFPLVAAFSQECEPPQQDDSKQLEKLIAQLEAEKAKDRADAMQAIGMMGEKGAPAVPGLIKRLKDENFHMRYFACRALAAIGPKAKAAIPGLLELLDEGVASSRGHAALALAAIGPTSDHDIVSALENHITDQNHLVRERVLISLGNLGQHAHKTLPTIREEMKRSTFNNHVVAVRALWKITGEVDESVARLIELADDFTYELRAVQVLGEMGPRAVKALELLERKLDSDDLDVSMAAATALGRMGPAAQPALVRLRELLDSATEESKPVFLQAIKMIKQTPSTSKKAKSDKADG